METIPKAVLIDGKRQAGEILERLKSQIAWLKQEHRIFPALAVVLVGEDPASQPYSELKTKRAAEIGMASHLYRLPSNVEERELLTLLQQLNQDRELHGILVQLPLPRQIDKMRILDSLNPAKDVDCFTPINLGLLYSGRPRFLPCTPQGILLLLASVFPEGLRGKKAIVIGRSLIVGRPLAELLLQRDRTVTLAHSASQNLPEECRNADILVAAVGVPNLVKGSWIKPGACVIDVGITRLANGKICGDVHFATAGKRAGVITPVPGGVGPMTIASLLANTVIASCQQNSIALESLPYEQK